MIGASVTAGEIAKLIVARGVRTMTIDSATPLPTG